MPRLATSRRNPGPKRSRQASKTVLPKNFKVRYGSDRLIDIRSELTKLKRDDFPNAGAVLLRVFLELAALDFLERTGDLTRLTTSLRNQNKLPRRGVPTMRDLAKQLTKTARKRLRKADANRVEKALRYDPAAPFSLSDLHAFVHQIEDLPSGQDIQQFWTRTEALFRMMLEDPLPNGDE